MGRRARGRFLVADLAVVGTVAVLVIVLVLLTGRRSADAGTPPLPAVPVAQGFAKGSAIPAGFLGLSLEYPAVEQYAGDNPAAVDPVLEQLIRNLAPGQRPVLRIGGDSSDWTWWPVPGTAQPGGVTFTLNQRWLMVTRALAAGLGARLILGLNLAANDRALAAAEARALLNGLGSGYVQALEIGNEPELYGAFAWYRTPGGQVVTARPAGYDFAAFTRDFTNFGAALPGVSLAGPAISGTGWFPNLSQFAGAEPALRLLTVHRYPLQNCFTQPGRARYPTIGHLLSNAASNGLARALAPYASVAHQHGLPIRIDELNTVSCGAYPQLSKSFASALWALDTLFELAHAGVDGVNVHTFPDAGYELFKLSSVNGGWRAEVAPEYYGLLMFAQAAPPGSRLVRIGGSGGPVKIWATRAPDGQVRIVMINKDVARPHVVKLQPGYVSGSARLERLMAPSAAASTGVTLGGQSFGPETDTGSLAQLSQTAVQQSAGHYAISLPAASAALLTLPGGDG
jgi:Glycosyl hydrolase family 79 C-terminal beta domain